MTLHTRRTFLATLGVAALVAIDSFSDNIIQSVKDQSRALMGGDVSFNTNKPLPPAIDSLFDSLSRHGILFARVTTFPSMAVVPRTTGTRSVGFLLVSDAHSSGATVCTCSRHCSKSVTARSAAPSAAYDIPIWCDPKVGRDRGET